MSALGSRLKAERLAAGLTQQALADEAGVSKQAISQIETGGTQNPEAATLDPIAKRLNVRQSWLLKGTGPKHPTGADSSQHMGFELEKISDALRLLGQLQRITRDPAHTGENPRSLEIAYRIVDAESRVPSGASVHDLVERLAARLRDDQEEKDGDQRRTAEGIGREDGRGDGRRTRKA